MTRLTVALASCADLPDWEVDDRPLHRALAQRGVAWQMPAWDDPSVDWSRFDAVLIRTTWDYMERREQYVRWANDVAAVTRLFNPPDVVAWNTDKRYLRELEAAGVPIAPTRWLEPNVAVDLAAILAEAGWDRAFCKPWIGATARETMRFGRGLWPVDEAQRHLDRVSAAEGMMVQPYLERVESEGEVSCVFFDGAFSHAVRKIPVPGDYRVQDDFGASDRPEAADDATIALCRRALAVVPSPTEPLLYGRVDLLADNDGDWVVTEVEVVEPSLFFRHDASAAERLADALLRRLGHPPGAIE